MTTHSKTDESMAWVDREGYHIAIASEVTLAIAGCEAGGD